MDIKEVWQALKYDYGNIDLIKAFRRSMTTLRVERLLGEMEADKARIAELEAQLMQAEMDRDAYKRGAAIAESQLKDCGDKLIAAQSDALNTALEVDRLKVQLKTAKRDALQNLADGLEIPPTKDGPFIWGHLHSQIMYEIDALDANTIGEG